MGRPAFLSKKASSVRPLCVVAAVVMVVDNGRSALPLWH